MNSAQTIEMLIPREIIVNSATHVQHSCLQRPNALLFLTGSKELNCAWSARKTKKNHKCLKLLLCDMNHQVSVVLTLRPKWKSDSVFLVRSIYVNLPLTRRTSVE